MNADDVNEESEKILSSKKKIEESTSKNIECKVNEKQNLANNDDNEKDDKENNDDNQSIRDDDDVEEESDNNGDEDNNNKNTEKINKDENKTETTKLGKIVNCDKSNCDKEVNKDKVNYKSGMDVNDNNNSDDDVDNNNNDEENDDDNDDDNNASSENLITKMNNISSEKILKHLTADRVKGPSKRRLPTKNKVQNDISIKTDTVDTINKTVTEEKASTHLIDSPKVTTVENKKKTSPFVLELESKLKAKPKLPRNLDIKITNENNHNNNLTKEITVNRANSFNTNRLRSPMNKSPPETLKFNSISKSSTISAIHAQSTCNASTVPTSAGTTMLGNNLFKLKQLETKCEEQDERIKELETELNTLKQMIINRKEFDDLVEKVNKIEKLVNCKENQ